MKTLAVVGKAPRFRQDVPATNPISWVWYSALSLPLAEDYAVRLATRFGDRVAAWELNNEPDVFLYPGSAYTTRQDAYATEALAYTTGLRSVLPESYILLGSATINRSPELWIGDALSSERTNANGQRLRDLVDGVSYHNYDLDPATTRSWFQRSAPSFRKSPLPPTRRASPRFRSGTRNGHRSALRVHSPVRNPPL